jgi:hypothetical protein
MFLLKVLYGDMMVSHVGVMNMDIHAYDRYAQP